MSIIKLGIRKMNAIQVALYTEVLIKGVQGNILPITEPKYRGFEGETVATHCGYR